METVLYTVLPGNTLFGIGNFFGTTAEEIANLNNISEMDIIYPGQVLKIPVSKPMAPEYYVVRPEDTLYFIATRYGLTVGDILSINNLGNPNLIYPGQILKLR